MKFVTVFNFLFLSFFISNSLSFVLNNGSDLLISKCTKIFLAILCRDLEINTTVIDFSSILDNLEEDEREGIFKIDFGFNQIEEIRNSELGKDTFLNHIVDFNLNNNHIRKLSKKPFKHFYNLRKLDLNRNNLAEIDDNFLFNLTSLIHLDLSDNQLQFLDLNVFKNTPELKKLDLSGNPSLFQNNVFKLNSSLIPALEKLSLKNNGLLNLNSINFDGSLILNIVNLGKNLFQRIPNDELSNLKYLKVLDISGNNNIVNLNKDDFKSLTAVEQLRITTMGKLKRIKEFTFSGLLKLREVVISFNPMLKDINERAFVIPRLSYDGSSNKNITIGSTYLPDLKVVEINNNNLNKISHNLFNVNKLIKFDISNNPLRCNGNLNFLFELTNTSILLNQRQTNCSTPTKLAGQSFYSLRAAGLKEFEKEHFLDEEHQAFFGLLCVIIVSFLVVCSICILKTIRFKERTQKTSHRFYELGGFRIGVWNCFNCCGLTKTKGFYNNFNIPNAGQEMSWDDDQELESPN